MREDIKNRVFEEAEYIANTNSTVRRTASVFHSSKSTVQKDVTERLYELDKELYERGILFVTPSLDYEFAKGYAHIGVIKELEKNNES